MPANFSELLKDVLEGDHRALISWIEYTKKHEFRPTEIEDAKKEIKELIFDNTNIRRFYLGVYLETLWREHEIGSHMSDPRTLENRYQQVIDKTENSFAMYSLGSLYLTQSQDKQLEKVDRNIHLAKEKAIEAEKTISEAEKQIEKAKSDIQIAEAGIKNAEDQLEKANQSKKLAPEIQSQAEALIKEMQELKANADKIIKEAQKHIQNAKNVISRVQDREKAKQELFAKEAKGLELMERAAALNNPLAINTLASYYLLGNARTPKDPEKAFNLFLRSAEMDNPYAQKMLALMYKKGLGLPKDEEKIYKHLNQEDKVKIISYINSFGSFLDEKYKGEPNKIFVREAKKLCEDAAITLPPEKFKQQLYSQLSTLAANSFTHRDKKLRDFADKVLDRINYISFGAASKLKEKLTGTKTFSEDQTARQKHFKSKLDEIMGDSEEVNKDQALPKNFGPLG